MLLYFDKAWKAVLTFLAANDPNSSIQNNQVTQAIPPVRTVIEVLPPSYTGVTGEPCVVSLLTHTFGFSYTAPNVTTFEATTCSKDYSVVYLKWSAFCNSGRQFDRFGAVWINGVELLRTTTAEPSSNQAVQWEVVRDVTNYYDVISAGGTLVVALDNIVDSTYTSSFTIQLSAEFFKPSPKSARKKPDLVLPVSASNTTYGWFSVQSSQSAFESSMLVMNSEILMIEPKVISSTQIQLDHALVTSTAATASRMVTLPANTEELYIEIFVSAHSCDEFWYANSRLFEDQGDSCASGSFREVQVLVDDNLVGVIWTDPLIYTGGINPYLYNVIVDTGAFLVPTYILNLTPFLGLFLDSEPHKVSFYVDYSINTWLIDGNLLVYLDKDGKQTESEILNQQIKPHVLPKEKLKWLDSTHAFYNVIASRRFYIQSRVRTSKGTQIYTIDDNFKYSNYQKYFFDGDILTQDVDMHSVVNGRASIKRGIKSARMEYSAAYPLKLQYFQNSNATYFLVLTNISTGFFRSSEADQKDTIGFRYGYPSNELLYIKWKGNGFIGSQVGGYGVTESALVNKMPNDDCFFREAFAEGAQLIKDNNKTFSDNSKECQRQVKELMAEDTFMKTVVPHRYTRGV